MMPQKKQLLLTDLKNDIQYSPGSVVSKTLLEKKTGTVTLFAFEKEQALSEHTAPYDALAQVLEGSAEITVGKERITVPEGRLLLMPAHIPHALRAVENFKMLLTMIKS